MNMQHTIYITLDRRHNRIRITDDALSKIGSPKHLQFLINPSAKMFLIRAIKKPNAAEQTYKLPPKSVRGACVELYSKILVDRFGETFNEYQRDHIYRIYGKLLPDQKSLCFNLADYQDSQSEML